MSHNAVNRISLITCRDPRWAWCCEDYYLGLPPLVSTAHGLTLHHSRDGLFFLSFQPRRESELQRG
jgi:hypothetical protein